MSSPEFQTTLVSVSGTPSFLDGVSMSSSFLWVPILFLLCFSIFRAVLVNDESNITCTPMDAFHFLALPACWTAKGLLVDTLNSKGLIHSIYLPQTTSHLFLVLCLSQSSLA